MCVCACSYRWMCVPVHGEARGQPWVLLLRCYPPFFEAGSLLSLELTDGLMVLDLLAREPPGSSLSRLPYHRGDKHTPLACNFHMVSENQIQKFLLARQAFTNWTVYWVWTSPIVKYLESFNIPRSIVTSTERQVSVKSVVLFNSWLNKVEQKLVHERVLCHPSPAHSTTLSQQPSGAYTHGSNPFIWLECPQHTL